MTAKTHRTPLIMSYIVNEWKPITVTNRSYDGFYSSSLFLCQALSNEDPSIALIEVNYRGGATTDRWRSPTLIASQGRYFCSNLTRLTVINKPPLAGGRGGTSLYKPYRYVLPQGVGFLLHFGLEPGMVFKRTTVAGTNVFIVSIPNEYERKRNMRIRNGLLEIYSVAGLI